VLLVDSDPQGSARDWHAAGNGELLDVVGLDRPTLDKDIRKFKSSYDYIVIDGAPHLSTMATKAIICSDLVLIPVQPSPYDVWASKDLVDLVQQRREISDGYPEVAMVVSRQIVGTKIGDEVRKALSEYELPVYAAGTCQRVSYATTAAEGFTVMGYDRMAQIEIEEIVKEILNVKD
jgi:chromosome partitioning protein